MILGKSETVQITIRDTKTVFTCTKFLPHVARQAIGPHISRNWLEHLDDESLDANDTAESESWVSQDLFRSYTSVEPVSDLDYSQIGMAAIVMGDVNSVYPLESAHRRQLFAWRALNERSLLIRGLPFPRTKKIGDVYIGDLVILSVAQFSNVHVD